MNKHVLALSTALSILAFSPAFAQSSSTAPKVDCTQEANKNDPSCANKLNNNNATTTQTQTGQTQSGTATTAPSTDQNAQSTTTTTAPATNQNAEAPAKTDQSGTAAQTTTTTTTNGQTQMSGYLIVPADRLNNAQMMSANDYIGKTVYDTAGNNIGDVNDLIISSDGQIQAVILGVGGFLGIGEKDVAVNAQSVKMVQDGDNKRLVVEATKEALHNAPTYDKNNRRYANSSSTTTTTDQTGSTTAPAPAPAPATNSTTTNSNGATIDCTQEANKTDPACASKSQ